MEITKTNHEVKGDYKVISEIHQDYLVRDNGDEVRLGAPHRPPRHHPGTLVDGTYVKTDLNTLDTDAKALAAHFWTEELHTDYEAYLKANVATTVSDS